MRVATIELDGAERVAVVEGESVWPQPEGTTVLGLIESGRVDESEPALPLESVRLLPSIKPGAIRDFVAFEQHIEGAKKGVEGDAGGVPAAWYEAPTFLFMNPHAGIGASDDVPVPAGCVIFNDWSARDIQGREMTVGLGPAKGKDFANTIGPWIVTPDELEPYRRADRLDLEMTVWINDERIGGDRLSSMAWSFEEMLAYAARGANVRAGDLLPPGAWGGGGLGEHWGRNGRCDPPPLEP